MRLRRNPQPDFQGPARHSWTQQELLRSLPRPKPILSYVRSQFFFARQKSIFTSCSASTKTHVIFVITDRHSFFFVSDFLTHFIAMVAAYACILTII